MLEQLPEIPLSRLKMVGRIVRSGSEKDVYRVTDGQRIMAGKFFREFYDGTNDPINKEQSSRDELYAYQTLRTSPLNPYIPEPYGLIVGQGEVLGLGVEWLHDAVPLINTFRRRLITVSMVDALERLVEEVYKTGFYLEEDVLTDLNLLFARGRRQLFFAECLLTTQDGEAARNEANLKRYMAYIRSHYSKDIPRDF